MATQQQARRPATEWKPWHVGLMLMTAWLVAAPALVLTTGAPAWLPLLLTALLLIVQFPSGQVRLGKLQGRAMTVTLVAMTIYAFPVWTIDGVRAAERDYESRRDALISMAASDRVAFAAALQRADDSMLSAMERTEPKMVRAERERREQQASEQRRRDGLAAEKQNAEQIAVQSKTLAATSEFDRLGRIAIYRKLTELAPANDEYRRKLIQLNQQEQDELYRIKHPAANLEVVSTSAQRGGFGTIFLLDIELKNTGRYAIKDFEIVCTNRAASGTLRPASRTTVYEVLKPGQTRMFKKLNLGLIPEGSASTECSVEGAQPH